MGIDVDESWSMLLFFDDDEDDDDDDDVFVE
jgi:hypothetical protein